MTHFHVTYDTCTPESAAEGDYADGGFIDAEGARRSLEGLWGEAAGKIKDECRLTLRQALDAFGTRFNTLEHDGDSYRWCEFSTVSHVTGEEERLGLHLPETLTDASRARLQRLLRVERLI